MTETLLLFFFLHQNNEVLVVLILGASAVSIAIQNKKGKSLRPFYFFSFCIRTAGYSGNIKRFFFSLRILYELLTSCRPLRWNQGRIIQGGNVSYTVNLFSFLRQKKNANCKCLGIKVQNCSLLPSHLCSLNK